jgi:hypothetical protein
MIMYIIYNDDGSIDSISMDLEYCKSCGKRYSILGSGEIIEPPKPRHLKIVEPLH